MRGAKRNGVSHVLSLQNMENEVHLLLLFDIQKLKVFQAQQGFVPLIPDQELPDLGKTL